MGAPKDDQPPPFPSDQPSTSTTTGTTTSPPSTSTSPNPTVNPANPPPPYDPPAYELRPETAAPDPDTLLDPCTFVIHGRFIYPMQTDTAGSEPSSQPAYQLSRAIHEQGAATEHISFQRLDARIRMTTTTDPEDVNLGVAGETIPRLTHRPKDLYKLEHRKEMAYLGIPFQAWLEPQTRRGMGKVQIEKAPLFHSGYRVAKMWGEAEVRALEREGKGKMVKKGEVYFALKEAGGHKRSVSVGGGNGSGSGHKSSESVGGGEPGTSSGGWWEWSDQDGKVVAVQVREWDARGEETFKLRVTAPLARRWRDGLVGLWCLWMWHVRMLETVPKRTWEDRKRILRMPRLGPN